MMFGSRHFGSQHGARRTSRITYFIKKCCAVLVQDFGSENHRLSKQPHRVIESHQFDFFSVVFVMLHCDLLTSPTWLVFNDAALTDTASPALQLSDIARRSH